MPDHCPQTRRRPEGEFPDERLPVIRIACAGFPVGRSRYERELSVVELSALSRTTRPSTVDKWRAQSKAGFEFVVVSPTFLSSASRANATRVSAEKKKDPRDLAFSRSFSAAETLGSRLVLFPMPGTLPPSPDAIQKLQRFFSSAPRADRQFVWTPPSFWPASLVGDLSRSLRLVPAIDPFRPVLRGVPSAFRYYRVSRRKPLGQVSEAELRAIRAACDRPLNYVVFDTGPSAFEDAIRFKSVI